MMKIKIDNFAHSNNLKNTATANPDRMPPRGTYIGTGQDKWSLTECAWDISHEGLGKQVNWKIKLII